MRKDRVAITVTLLTICAVALAYHLASRLENTLSGIVSWVASLILLAFYSSWRQVDGNRRGSWFKPDSKQQQRG